MIALNVQVLFLSSQETIAFDLNKISLTIATCSKW